MFPTQRVPSPSWQNVVLHAEQLLTPSPSRGPSCPQKLPQAQPGRGRPGRRPRAWPLQEGERRVLTNGHTRPGPAHEVDAPGRTRGLQPGAPAPQKLRCTTERASRGSSHDTVCTASGWLGGLPSRSSQQQAAMPGSLTAAPPPQALPTFGHQLLSQSRAGALSAPPLRPSPGSWDSTSQPHPGQAGRPMAGRPDLGLPPHPRPEQRLRPACGCGCSDSPRSAGVAGADLAVRGPGPGPPAPLRRVYPAFTSSVCLSPGPCCGSASSLDSGQSLNLSQAE